MEGRLPGGVKADCGGGGGVAPGVCGEGHEAKTLSLDPPWRD